MSRFEVYDLVLDDPEAVVEPVKKTIQHQIFAPFPGQQTKYMSCDATEVLFGGAAGPGKSFVLVFDALGIQFKDTDFGIAAYEHPHYRAVLFRRTSPRLQNLIDIAKELYTPLGAEYVMQRKNEPGSSFSFPSGAKIFFCHLEDAKDVDSHQGSPYQFIGFDELPQFLYSQYVYFFSRLRGNVTHNGVSLKKRIRATANPIGEGLVWVKKRFIKTNQKVFTPEIPAWFIADTEVKDINDNPTGIEVFPDDKRFLHAKSRVFIPGYLYENTILMESDPGYAANIMQLGRKMENALLHNDWDAFGGDFFDMFNKEDAAEDPFDIPETWNLYGSIDPGWTSPCSFSLWARDFKRHIHLLFTYYVSRKDPETHARSIYKLIKEFPYTKGRMPDLIVSGLDAFAKKDLYKYKATELTFADIFNSCGLYLQPAYTSRIIGWWTVKQYMQNAMFHYFKGYNNSALDEITSLQTDEDNVEDIKGGGNDPQVADHFTDQMRYACMAIPYPFKKAQKYLPDDRPAGYNKKKNSNKQLTVMSK
jgi:hypothetical protein